MSSCLHLITKTVLFQKSFGQRCWRSKDVGFVALAPAFTGGTTGGRRVGVVGETLSESGKHLTIATNRKSNQQGH